MVKKRNGFGIIECVISIMLLTFVMVGGMSFYIYSNSHLKLLTFQRIAADLANSKMEEVKKIGFDNFNTACPDTNPDTSHMIGVFAANITACVSAVLNDACTDCASFKQVVVDVNWVEQNQNKNLTLSSFITE